MCPLVRAGEGVRGVWLKLPLELSQLVPVATGLGFVYHHAEPEYLMLTKWLPNTPCTLPANASHQVSVALQCGSCRACMRLRVALHIHNSCMRLTSRTARPTSSLGPRAGRRGCLRGQLPRRSAGGAGAVRRVAGKGRVEGAPRDGERTGACERRAGVRRAGKGACVCHAACVPLG